MVNELITGKKIKRMERKIIAIEAASEPATTQCVFDNIAVDSVG